MNTELARLLQAASKESLDTVREAIATIRRVEQLGGVRSVYNLASPFSNANLLAKNMASIRSLDTISAPALQIHNATCASKAVEPNEL